MKQPQRLQQPWQGFIPRRQGQHTENRLQTESTGNTKQTEIPQLGVRFGPNFRLPAQANWHRLASPWSPLAGCCGTPDRTTEVNLP